jgi:ribosomal protein S18 acetylase RimI-like enzyme
MTFKLRPATADDAQAIAQVHVTSWQHTYAALLPQTVLANLSVAQRQVQWLQWLTDPQPDHVLWVAEQEDQIGAFVCAGPERTQHPTLHGEIYAIYLLPAWQRQGIGRALWQAACAQLQAAGLSGIRVWVWRDNPAVAFYVAQGGLLEAVRTVAIYGVEVPEISYAWPQDRAEMNAD